MLIGYIQLESHIILSTDHYIRKLADEDMAILFNIKQDKSLTIQYRISFSTIPAVKEKVMSVVMIQLISHLCCGKKERRN